MGSIERATSNVRFRMARGDCIGMTGRRGREMAVVPENDGREIRDVRKKHF